jgi:hypothetical protein
VKLARIKNIYVTLFHSSVASKKTDLMQVKSRILVTRDWGSQSEEGKIEMRQSMGIRLY